MTTEKPPGRLFKYQPFNATTIANLTQRSLWFSDPGDFNDPYDCALSVLDESLDDAGIMKAFAYMREQMSDKGAFDSAYLAGDKPNAAFVDEIRRGMSGTFAEIFATKRGIACFASSWDNLLMWAHYADGHRGFCLEFDSAFDPFHLARPVAYESTMPRIRAVDIFVDRPSQDLIDAWLITKSAHWEYEKEWRIIHKNPRTIYGYPWQALKRVYLGAGMNNTQTVILALILQGSGTHFSKVVRDQSTFALTAAPVTFKPFDYKA